MYVLVKKITKIILYYHTWNCVNLYQDSAQKEEKKKKDKPLPVSNPAKPVIYQTEAGTQLPRAVENQPSRERQFRRPVQSPPVQQQDRDTQAQLNVSNLHFGW